MDSRHKTTSSGTFITLIRTLNPNAASDVIQRATVLAEALHYENTTQFTFATLFKSLNPTISQQMLEQAIKLTEDMHPKSENTTSYKK